MDGKLPRLTLGASFLSFTNEGCCCRGCTTSWWSIFMLCRTFFNLNHVLVFKLVSVLVCWHIWRRAISCLEAVIENWWNFFMAEFRTLCITWPNDLSDKILGNNFSHQAYVFYCLCAIKTWLIVVFNWAVCRWFKLLLDSLGVSLGN